MLNNIENKLRPTFINITKRLHNIVWHKWDTPWYWEQVKWNIKQRMNAPICRHIVSQGKFDEKGSWCRACGLKVMDVDNRECQHCVHSKRLLGDSWICRKHLMAITPNMHVTFTIDKGTCWTDKMSIS